MKTHSTDNGLTNGEMIDQIMEWINTDGEELSDEDVINKIRDLVKPL